MISFIKIYNPHNSRSAFSLLEIIVAVAIMTILVGAAIPVLSVSVNRAKKKETRKELNTLQDGLQGYFYDVWVLPSDLNELLTNNAGRAGWVGPYVSLPLSVNSSEVPDITKDAWSNDYVISIADSSRMEIKSSGPDGSPGTSDDFAINVDVTHLRREKTIYELNIINNTINVYNSINLETNPLPADWTVIYNRLVTLGFLPPGSSDLLTDGWNDVYVPDPLLVQPVISVTSTNID